MPKEISNFNELHNELESMEPWPGLPTGTRAVVTRKMQEDSESETLVVRGYLRIGSVLYGPDMLYGADGMPLYQSVCAGDYIDSYTTFKKFNYHLLKRARKG